MARAITPRLACLAALALALFPLGFAWGEELFAHLIPCPLCLVERQPYYVAAVLAAVGLVLPARAARLILAAITLCFLASAALAFTHAGVEWQWWKSPLPACNAPDLSGLSLRDRLLAMPLRPARPCEDPDYPIPYLPLSFVQLGLLYALAACTISALLTRAARKEA